MSYQLSASEQEELSKAYSQSVNISNNKLSSPIVLYTDMDWINEHKNYFYLIILGAALTGYYLCKYQSGELSFDHFVESG